MHTITLNCIVRLKNCSKLKLLGVIASTIHELLETYVYSFEVFGQYGSKGGKS